MNHSLQFVRPVMSLDATHLKSKSKGTMYLATVKTGLKKIYTVAISIERANECYDGWNYFLQHLNIACPLIATNHPLEAHKRHGYFTFVSDRDKGLVQALKDVFPTNHTTRCSIHIQRNVAAKLSNKVAADICNISKTFSVYQENKMLDNIKESSELAYDYLVGDNGIEPSKWRST
jgi:MULE transposase domain